ncbi:MAG: penicillin acylase family protein [Bdellovibrionales bacterium]|nr:penicillin acylase family protein [Bdellovibrionales bacterium]
MAQESSNELKALLNLNRSQSFQQCLSSLVDFRSPAQNFICADANNISIRHNGRLPKRQNGQGTFVLDGRFSKENWQGWLSSEEALKKLIQHQALFIQRISVLSLELDPVTWDGVTQKHFVANELSIFYRRRHISMCSI